MIKLNQIINKLYEQKDLTVEESSFIFNEIMDGKVNEIIISSFLTALKIKGETFTEILGARYSDFQSFVLAIFTSL